MCEHQQKQPKKKDKLAVFFLAIAAVAAVKIIQKGLFIN